jgi:hypothetical protein
LLVTTGVVTVPQSITVLLVQQQAQQQVPQSQRERVLLLQRVQQQVPQSQQAQQQVLQQAQRLLLFGHKLSKRTQPTRQLRELIFS